MINDNRQNETPMPAATWKPAIGKDARKAKNPNRADRDDGPAKPGQAGAAKPRDATDAGDRE